MLNATACVSPSSVIFDWCQDAMDDSRTRAFHHDLSYSGSRMAPPPPHPFCHCTTPGKCRLELQLWLVATLTVPRQYILVLVVARLSDLRIITIKYFAVLPNSAHNFSRVKFSWFTREFEILWEKNFAAAREKVHTARRARRKSPAAQLVYVQYTSSFSVCRNLGFFWWGKSSSSSVFLNEASILCICRRDWTKADGI